MYLPCYLYVQPVVVGGVCEGVKGCACALVTGCPVTRERLGLEGEELFLE